MSNDKREKYRQGRGKKKRNVSDIYSKSDQSSHWKSA